MSGRFDELDGHLEALLRLRKRAAGDVYERAVQAARVAVARVVLTEAERLVGMERRTQERTVVLFRKRSFEHRAPRTEER